MGEGGVWGREAAWAVMPVPRTRQPSIPASVANRMPKRATSRRAVFSTHSHKMTHSFYSGM